MSRTLTGGPKAFGNTLAVLFVPTRSGRAFGPLWSALAGACAAVGQELADNSSLVRLWRADTFGDLVLTLFIVEILWSTWRSLLVDVNWSVLNPSEPAREGEPIPRLPYTTPWSPLGRFFGRVEYARRWARDCAQAEMRGALITLPLLPPLILLLSVVVNGSAVILSLAALSLALIEWRVASKGTTTFALQALSQVGLSWLAGHVALNSLTWSSFTLACCYALAYQGALTLDAAQPATSGRRRLWALALLYGGQIAAFALLAALRHPLSATVVGFLLAPQLLLLPRLGSSTESGWYLRHAVPFVMLAMPIAAWTASA
jgi:hypothetical protein